MKLLLTAILIIVLTGRVSAEIDLWLDRVECVSEGDEVDIAVRIEYPSGSYELGGFDFTISYDSRLQFIAAQSGELINNCDWEYFNYSLIDSNTVRVISIAEINNGGFHPSCYAEQGGELTYLQFTIGEDSAVTDNFYPVWWEWMDCGDNSLSSKSGFVLYISDSVYYYDGITEINITRSEPFPSPYGAPDICITDTSTAIVREIDIHSGGVDITPVNFRILCPSDLFFQSDSGLCGANVFYGASVSHDCPGAEIILTPPSGSFLPTGRHEIACTAADDYGHFDSCSFEVLVYDNGDPIVSCPYDTSVFSLPGEWYVPVHFTVTAFDDCSPVTVQSDPFSGTNFAIGTTIVTSVATDSSGNTDSCQFMVTVQDVEPPQITCPEDIVVANEPNSCGALVNYELTAVDNSLQVTTIGLPESGSFFPVGSTMVFATAVDPFGNTDSCQFYVIVEDVESPTLTCPDDIHVFNDPDHCGAVVEYDISVIDNCPDLPININYSTGTFFPIGSTLVSSDVSDSFGNSDSCSFYVIVADSTRPVITCPLDITLPNDIGECGGYVDFTVTATDNCDSLVYSSFPETGTLFPLGVTEVLSIVADLSGNADSCLFSVTVFDEEAPVINCPGDIVVQNDDLTYGAVVTYDIPIIDNCSLIDSLVSIPSGTLFDIGNTEVVVVASDSSGNVDSCSFLVTVILADEDLDGVADFEDNCLTDFNPGQEDTNNDGIGDACCCVGIRGNIDGSPESYPDNIGIDIADIVYLISYSFGSPAGPAPVCPEEADVDGSGNQNIADVVYLIAYAFGTPAGPPPVMCE